MADPVLNYVPVDGAPLDVPGLNENLYSNTPSISLYETSNGKIELGNFAAGFKVQSWHIQPGEAAYGASVGKIFSADYFQDAYGPGLRYVPVAGAVFTFRQRWAAGLTLAFASCSFSSWRSPGPLIDPANPPVAASADWDTPPRMFLRMFFDGYDLEGTKRQLPQTVQYKGDGVSPKVELQHFEQTGTRHFNLFQSAYTAGTLSHTQLQKRNVSFGLALYLQMNTQGHDTANANDRLDFTAYTKKPEAWYNACHRARAYVRNAGFVTIR